MKIALAIAAGMIALTGCGTDVNLPEDKIVRVSVVDLERQSNSDHWAEGDDNADGWLTPGESGWATVPQG